MELVDEKMTHAFGVIDAALELVARVPVRYPADHSLLPPVAARGGARQRVGRRRRERGSGERRVGGGRGRRGAAWVGDVGDGLAKGAADGSGARRELQRRLAVGAVDKHHWVVHLVNSRTSQGLNRN